MNSQKNLASILAVAIGLAGTPDLAAAKKPVQQPIAILLEDPTITATPTEFYQGQRLQLTVKGDVPEGAYFDVNDNGIKDADESAAPIEVTLDAVGQKRFVLYNSDNSLIAATPVFDVKVLPASSVDGTQSFVSSVLEQPEQPVVISGQSIETISSSKGLERLVVVGGLGMKSLDMNEKLRLLTNRNNSRFNPTDLAVALHFDTVYRLSDAFLLSGDFNLLLGNYDTVSVKQNGDVIGAVHGTLIDYQLRFNADWQFAKLFSLYAQAGFSANFFSFVGNGTLKGHTKGIQLSDNTTDLRGAVNLGLLAGNRSKSYGALSLGVGGSELGRHVLSGAEYNISLEGAWQIITDLRLFGELSYLSSVTDLAGKDTLFDLSQYSGLVGVEYNVANTGFCVRLVAGAADNILTGYKVVQDDIGSFFTLSLGYSGGSSTEKIRSPTMEELDKQFGQLQLVGQVASVQSSAAVSSDTELRAEEPLVETKTVSESMESIINLYNRTDVVYGPFQKYLSVSMTPFDLYQQLRTFIPTLAVYESKSIFDRQIGNDADTIYEFINSDRDSQTIIPFSIQDAFQRDPSLYQVTTELIQAKSRSVTIGKDYYAALQERFDQIYTSVKEDCFKFNICTENPAEKQNPSEEH